MTVHLREHSYAYVNGNPLAGTDPLGLFHIPAGYFTGLSPLNELWGLDKHGGHGDIVPIAFSQYMRASGNQGRFSQHFVEWVIRNNYHSDVNGSVSCFPVGWTSGGGQCNPKNHFDNPNDGPMYEIDGTTRTSSYTDGKHDDWINESLGQLNENRQRYGTLPAIQGEGANLSPLLAAFGQNAHAMADFYAHTNWVDANTRGGCVGNESSVPKSVEIGYVPKGLDRNVVWDEISTPELFSGTVAGANRYCPIPQMGDIKCTDPTTHGYWNKDGSDTDAGTQKYESKTIIVGWRIEAYDPDASPGTVGNPGTGYGTYWYSDTAGSIADLKKGDLIQRSYNIESKHELAFHLAVQHTKQEIEKLFAASAKISTAGYGLHSIFKMDKEQMKKNNIIYDNNISKE